MRCCGVGLGRCRWMGGTYRHLASCGGEEEEEEVEVDGGGAG